VNALWASILSLRSFSQFRAVLRAMPSSSAALTRVMPEARISTNRSLISNGCLCLEMGIAHSATSILVRALQDMPHLIDPSRPAGQAVTVALIDSPGPGQDNPHQTPLRPLQSKKAESPTLRHLSRLDSSDPGGRVLRCVLRLHEKCRKLYLGYNFYKITMLPLSV